MIPCFLSVILYFLGMISCFLAVITCILVVISSILAVISCILAVNHVLLLCFQACKHFFDGEKCVAHCPPPLIYDSEKFEYRRNPDVKYSYGTLCVDKCPCEYPHAYTHIENHTHVHIHSIHTSDIDTFENRLTLTCSWPGFPLGTGKPGNMGRHFPVREF